MLIKKGPFGYFATETTNETIFKYACEIMEINEYGIFLPVYINDYRDETELSFEFTGYITIDEFNQEETKFDKKKISLRRKAVGNLFYSILKNLDHLISPTGIVLDSRYIFTNSSGTEIKVCNLPIYSDEYKLFLSTINKQNLEALLSNKFFSSVLTTDEISSIIFAISNNDEELLRDLVHRIKTDEIKVENKSKFSNTISWAFIFALITGISHFAFGIFPTLLFFGISAFLTYRFFISNKKEADSKTESEIISKERKQILFNDTEIASLNCAYLKSLKPINGEIFKYGIYMDKTTIGSDKFLSDIFIEDDSISSIHGVFEIIDSAIYISDYSDDNKTYIENTSLIPGNKYEIKNGQRITFGNLDFVINIS